MEEIWKDIKDYEGYYQVSNWGRIKSLLRVVLRKNGIPQTIREKIRKPSLHNQGYLKIYLAKNGKRKNCFIHRLVAQAFISNFKNLPEVNHRNGNKTDNHVINLEWLTASENQKHAFKTKLNKPFKGENHSNSKLNEKKVLKIRKEYFSKKISQRELAEKYKVNQYTIWSILNNKTWKHVEN